LSVKVRAFLWTERYYGIPLIYLTGLRSVFPPSITSPAERAVGPPPPAPAPMSRYGSTSVSGPVPCVPKDDLLDDLMASQPGLTGLGYRDKNQRTAGVSSPMYVGGYPT